MFVDKFSLCVQSASMNHLVYSCVSRHIKSERPCGVKCAKQNTRYEAFLESGRGNVKSSG